MATFAAIVAVLALTNGVHSFMSSYKANFTFTCPDKHALMTMESFDNTGVHDRIWHFDCHEMEGIPLGQCQWLPPNHDLGKTDNSKCGNDMVVAGVKSMYPDNHFVRINDRQWSYRCCQLGPNYILHACNYTDYLNDYHDQMGYTLPDGWFISGVNSVYDSRQRDRRYKLDVCLLSQVISSIG